MLSEHGNPMLPEQHSGHRTWLSVGEYITGWVEWHTDPETDERVEEVTALSGNPGIEASANQRLRRFIR